MYKHPISAFFRLLPALSWLAACTIAVWVPLRLSLNMHAEGRWGDVARGWPDALMLLGFVAVAIYAARMAYKEYKQALPALLADTPIGLGLPLRWRPQPFTPTRYPLSDTLRAELHKLIETLGGAGMLQSGEVAIDEILDRAETFDEWSTVDLYMAMNVLHVLRSERERPFANIAFFLNDVETDESDAMMIVWELARLCGRSREVGAVRVRSVSGGKIVPAHGEFPVPNAVAEFELGTEHHAVSFVLYRKSLPGGLIEALARIFTHPYDPRRFVWDNFGSFFSVCYLTPTQTSMINQRRAGEVSRFEEVT